MRSFFTAKLLVLVLFIFFSCEKKPISVDPIPEPIPCTLEKIKKESMPKVVSDSFYFTGKVNGIQWKPTYYNFRLGGDSHDPNNPFSYYYSIIDELSFCSYSVISVGRIRPFPSNHNDTFFLNSGNPIFRSVFVHRYEIKNNITWDEHTVAVEDSLSRNNYVVIQGFNSDTSIIWGAFQLKLVGGTKSPDFVVKDGKFRVKVTKVKL